MTLVTEDARRLRVIELVARAMSIRFTKSESEEYNPEFVEKIEQSKADLAAGRFKKISPSDIWN
ncbi:MAG: hypothetical protein IJR53_09390 [Bacteroidales bacterium]|nr:hypothetical protein [Bacteroidales bacterium]